MLIEQHAEQTSVEGENKAAAELLTTWMQSNDRALDRHSEQKGITSEDI